MTVNLVRSGSLYTGVPYAYASVAPRGSLIFTAGACPLDDRGEVVGAGDVRAQASLAVANLATALAESGATLADVLKTTVFVASAERSDLVAAWDVVSAAFGEHDAPSTLLGVTVLGYTDQLVEIEAIAASPEGQIHDHLSERAVARRSGAADGRRAQLATHSCCRCAL